MKGDRKRLSTIASREWIEDNTKVTIPANKRNYIKPDHIEVTTVKTADSLIIELNNHSKAILEKYKSVHFEDHKALPVISNQKMNDYLKELVLFEKSKMPDYGHDYGMLFLNYLPYQSLTYKILQMSDPQLTTNRYEWKDDIDFIVNPTDEYYRSFFTQPWTREMVEKIFPRSNFFKEFGKLIKGIGYLIKYELKKFTPRKKLLSLDEYKQLKGI